MTRRWLCLLALLGLVVCFAACTGKKPAEKPVTTDFSCDVEMTYRDMQLKGRLSRLSAGTLKMEFTEPASLKGMSMEWNGETISVKLGGLTFGMDPATVPESALGKGILEALDVCFRSDGKESTLTSDGVKTAGKSANGQFEMLSDADTGQLLSLKIPDLNITATFSHFARQ